MTDLREAVRVVGLEWTGSFDTWRRPQHHCPEGIGIYRTFWSNRWFWQEPGGDCHPAGNAGFEELEEAKSDAEAWWRAKAPLPPQGDGRKE